MKEHYFPFVNKSRRTVVGLMSGTSVDGIDAAVVSIEGQGENISVDVHAFFNTPFDTALRKRIFDAFNPKHATVDILGSLNMELAEAYAKAALHAIHASGLKTDDIDLICSHGQTVYHQPIAVNGQHAFSVQLGDGNVIAQRTGILCMTDFRIADIAAGGQGAPLVPYTEFLLYRSENESVLLQNIGGIANITVLPAGCTAQDVTAFDTGPGNMVIDALVSKIT
ncbi:MAG: anhydro-N-acetylmuramic acid kinase, partial [Spirochaetales bacterium]